MTRFSSSGVVLAALCTWLPTLAVAASSQTRFTSTDCLESATVTEINSLLRTGGEGTAVALCPFSQVSVDPTGVPITFTAARQSIYTSGFPEDHSRATVAIETDTHHEFGDLTTAIKADCATCRGVSIRNLQVDGGREQLGGVEGGDALILIGGEAGEQEVRWVDAFGARGYAIVHASEGRKGTCTGVVIAENDFHSSGDAPIDALLTSELRRLRDGPRPSLGQGRPGKWTDAISVACARSTVSENTIRDVSGVGIAVRGAPGTQVLQNTVVARDRDMLSGIAVVSNPIFVKPGVESHGVAIRENRVHAASAMIRVGISTGSGTWSTDEQEGDHQIPFGTEIVRNRLSSYAGYFAYAMALSDARGMVVEDNAVSASIWGFETTACYDKPKFVAPTPLLRDPRSVIGRIQPQFVDKHFGFALCVGPGSLSSSIEVSRHQINDLAAVQAASMPNRERDFRDGRRGASSSSGDEGASESSRPTKGRAVVHPVKAYKAVKAVPPKPPAIPKREWHPVHPLPGHAEAARLKVQELTEGGLGVSNDLGDPSTRSNSVVGASTSPSAAGSARTAAESAALKLDVEAKKGIQQKRLRGRRKMGSRSTHLFY
ncbi:hypothetical protein JCM10212_000772 [Sporobolomyces blumeae]